MKKVGIRVLSAVLTGSLLVMPVSAAPNADDIKKSKEKAQNEADSLQGQLTDIVEKINELEENLITTGEEIETVTVDLKETEELEKQQYEAMKLRIKYMYEEGDSTAFEALMNAKDFSDLVNKAEYVQTVHSYDREKLNEYIETKEKVIKLKTKLEKEREELAETATEFEGKESELTQLIADKQGEIADLDEQYQAAVEEAARKAEAEKKEREEKEAKKAAETAKTENSHSDSAKSEEKQEADSSEPEEKEEESSEPGYDTPVGGSVVDRAYGKLGCAYVYGACGPNTFDCSGFVSYCLTGKYTRIGTSGTFAGWPRVSNPQPGDVCVKPGHVGIYIGNGKMIHAPHTGDVVKISTVHSGMWYVRR